MYDRQPRTPPRGACPDMSLDFDHNVALASINILEVRVKQGKSTFRTSKSAGVFTQDF